MSSNTSVLNSQRVRGQSNFKVAPPFKPEQSLHSMSQQKASCRNSTDQGIEQERLYLAKANDQLRRCQIALFRYKKSMSKESGGEVTTATHHQSTSVGRRNGRDKLRTQGDMPEENSVDYLSMGLYKSQDRRGDTAGDRT